MTVSDILQLSAAGFSKAEILAMSNADTGKQKDERAKPEEKKETVAVSTDFAKALDEINKRLDALAEKKVEPEKKEEPKEKVNTDVLALLQSMNVSGQRYDLPPKYDVDTALANAAYDVLNGAKKGENNG